MMAKRLGGQLRLATFALVLLSIHAFAQGCDPKVGAIRWDAWHDDDSRVAQYIEKSLGEERWRDRWPFFFSTMSGDLDFDAAAAGAVRAENALADAAGIDYWAFVYYGRASPMSRALHAYQADRASKPCFTLVIEAARLADPAAGAPLRQDVVELLQDENFLRDGEKRPVLFIMISGAAKNKDWLVRQADQVNALKNAISKAGKGNAQTIIMAFDPVIAAEVAELTGSSVISSYASHGMVKNGKYADLVRSTENFWDAQARTGKNVVPIVMAGWDPRPRFDKPMPWGSGYSDGAYYQQGTSEEIAGHVKRGAQWVRKRTSGSCIVLVYAWNEFDEGGWLAPTVGQGLSRLRALGSVLKN
jgi:hypothetical protein